LGSAEVGDRLNLEVDVIAKYVERLLAKDGPPVEKTAATGGTR
jgi:riboflavin synthase alpha subunit